MFVAKVPGAYHLHWLGQPAGWPARWLATWPASWPAGWLASWPGSCGLLGASKARRRAPRTSWKPPGASWGLLEASWAFSWPRLVSHNFCWCLAPELLRLMPKAYGLSHFCVFSSGVLEYSHNPRLIFKLHLRSAFSCAQAHGTLPDASNRPFWEAFGGSAVYNQITSKIGHV